MNSYNYTTIEGETWASVSYKNYGTVNYITTLIANNPQVPVESILPAGTILIIPIIEQATLIQTAPWK